jgi:adenylosuccinate synthase
LTEKVYIVTDIGPGDGGKGGVVHSLANAEHAHTVIKRGGAQGSHGVHTSRGESFNFSQWGCGTFEGIPTFMSEQFIVHPEALLNEAKALIENGVKNPFDLISADGNALVATSFHGISSHVKELARGDNPRGTIGTGVGEAYRDCMEQPELIIRVRDLRDRHIDEKLEAVLKWQRAKLQTVFENAKFLAEDAELLEREKRLLYDDGFLRYEIERFRDVARRLRIATLQDILSLDGVAVVECSHGVINDREYGFKPHVSAIRTVPIFTNNLLDEAGYEEEIVNIAVHRAYSIRHGAGPLPTADPTMNELLLPGSNKDENRWQGKVRVGPLDFVQVQKAVADSKPIHFDGLALTWFDQIIKNGVWRYCHSYSDYGDPKITTLTIPQGLSQSELFDFAARTVENHTGLKVRMVSFGPTERDKLLK